MKSYKTYAEEYGLDIEVVRWVFNHIRVTRYVMSEPIGYKIAFKYLGQPVHLSSGRKTGVAEKIVPGNRQYTKKSHHDRSKPGTRSRQGLTCRYSRA